MLKELVSVIIPAYNAESFIKDSIKCVMEQTYPVIELIVVDDGSEDKTSEIIKQNINSFKNKINRKNIIYKYQNNRGPSHARNTGIKIAKGKYVAFLDVDDLWSKDKIEKQIKLFEKDKELDIIFTDLKIIRYKNDKKEEFNVFKKYNLDKEFFGHEYIVIKPLYKLLHMNFIHTSTVIAKRSCFKKHIYFNEKRKHVEDWELWLKMAIYFKFGYLSEICAVKRETGYGLSADRINMNLSSVEILEKVFTENPILQKIYPEKELKQLLKNKYKWPGYLLIKDDERGPARYFLKKSLHHSFDFKTLLYYAKTFL
jgi:glycosyltransferase involved in cell wall biosynthesis